MTDTNQKLREALRFTKKPVTIEAVQFTEALRDAILFDGEACPDGVKRGATTSHPPTRKVWRAEFFIQTLEGKMTVSVGDWIIKGVKGEYYPCKPDIFEATYAPAAEQALALSPSQPVTDEWSKGFKEGERYWLALSNGTVAHGYCETVTQVFWTNVGVVAKKDVLFVQPFTVPAHPLGEPKTNPLRKEAVR